jgi:4-diphosphocytidyl-2-C-methyl-D-erythritol kinase
MSCTALFDVAAPAKLNLFLHVVGRRADGYHLLQSVFVLIDWCDTLHFERRSDGRLARHDLSAALPADDLCLRAARSLQAAAGVTCGADISIDKQVPWGAGMGGGSSDAASTLLALNRLWGLNWPLVRLLSLGLKLGADVPFFLGGRNAWVEGIGERLTPLPIAALEFAVVKPEASLETRTIFTHPLLARNTDAATIEGFTAATRSTAELLRYGRNDLQSPAESQCPEVVAASELLRTRFGNSRMTGSGSAVFAGWGQNEIGAIGAAGAKDESAATLDALPAGWIGRMCRSLELHPLAGWASSGADEVC